MANIASINGNPIVTDGEKKSMLQQAYFVNFSSFEYEASGSDLLVYWSGNLALRAGGAAFKTGDWALSAVLSNLGSTYTGTDSKGRSCLKIPGSYAFCIDLNASPYYAVVERGSVDYTRYVPLLSVVSGKAVGGLLMDEYLRKPAVKAQADVSAMEAEFDAFLTSYRAAFYPTHWFTLAELGHGSIQSSGLIDASFVHIAVTDYIPVMPGETATIIAPDDVKVRAVGFYNTGSTDGARTVASGYNISGTREVTIPSDVTAIRISFNYVDRVGAGTDFASGFVANEIGIKRFYVPSATTEDKGIVALNPGIRSKLLQANRRLNTGTNTYQQLPPIFTLLHFSDVHGGGENLSRIQNFRDEYGDLLTDTICTGDIKASYFGSPMAFWSGATDGSILTCVGNHDAGTDPNNDWSYIATQQQLYECYVQPFAANWGSGVTTVTGKAYYRKEYAENEVMLIVMDTTIRDADEQAAQLAWLVAALADARSLGYAVVIAEHFPPVNMNKIGCTFTSVVRSGARDLGNYGWSTTYPSLMDAVEDFMDAGGEFVCWLCGHTHSDYVSYQTGYPRQPFVTVTTAKTQLVYQDCERRVGDKSQDAFNIVSVDTASHYLKLVRVGQDRDCYLRHLGTLTLDYSTSPATVVYND